MMSGQPLEIERKYLIRRPERALLDSLASEIGELEQVYLRRGEDGADRRIRRCGDGRCWYTEKRKLTDLRRIEHEREIRTEEYAALLSEADGALHPIRKTRWRIPWQGVLLEVDLFPFWEHQAFCEIELPDETAAVALPDWAELLREVTDDPAYTNYALAGAIPPEDGAERKNERNA